MCEEVLRCNIAISKKNISFKMLWIKKIIKSLRKISLVSLLMLMFLNLLAKSLN